MKKEKVTLKDGNVVVGDKFNNEDLKQFKDVFKDWVGLSNTLRSLGGRGLNVPDVLGEGLFCIFFNAVRTNNTNKSHSYDCVTRDGEGVQLKASSISRDCSSFGPNSHWDKLYFIDFAPNDIVDGNVYFYEIKDFDIYSLVLNTEMNETFKDQQDQKRRPRFSIKSRIVLEKGLKPVLKVNLSE